jgi:hypothetical protein
MNYMLCFKGRGGGRGGYNNGGGGSDEEGEEKGSGGFRGGRGGGRGRGGRSGGDDSFGGGDDNRNNGEGGGEGGEEERPRPYVPPVELEGEEAFEERNKIYSGSGINFKKYDKIDHKVRKLDNLVIIESGQWMMQSLTKIT